MDKKILEPVIRQVAPKDQFVEKLDFEIAKISEPYVASLLCQRATSQDTPEDTHYVEVKHDFFTPNTMNIGLEFADNGRYEDKGYYWSGLAATHASWVAFVIGDMRSVIMLQTDLIQEYMRPILRALKAKHGTHFVEDEDLRSFKSPEGALFIPAPLADIIGLQAVKKPELMSRLSKI